MADEVIFTDCLATYGNERPKFTYHVKVPGVDINIEFSDEEAKALRDGLLRVYPL